MSGLTYSPNSTEEPDYFKGGLVDNLELHLIDSSYEKTGYLSQKYISLEEQLLENITSAQDNNKIEPVVVVVPSLISSAYLQKQLRLAGVRFLNFKQLANNLAAGSLLKTKKDPIPFKGEECIARQAIKKVITDDSTLAAYKSCKGFPALLMSVLKDFRQGGFDKIENTPLVCEKFAQAAVKSGIIPETERLSIVFELLNTFRKTLSKHYFDVEDTLAYAGNNANSFKRVFGIDKIHIFGFSKFDETQQKLISKISEYANVNIYIPSVPDNLLCGQTRHLLNSWNFNSINLDTNTDNKYHSNLKILQNQLFSQNDDIIVNNNENDDSVNILSCPDASYEVREITREILRLADAEKIPFEKMAVILTDRPLYGELFREYFEKLGIPGYFHDGFPANHTPAGKSMTLLLNLINGNLDRFRIMELMDTGRLNTNNLFSGEDKPIPEIWDYISKKAGISQGIKLWQERLKAYKATLERRELLLEPDEDNQDIEKEIYQIHQLQRFIRIFNEDLSSFKGADSWSNYIKQVDELYNKYIIKDENFENIRHLIKRLEMLHEIEATVSFDDFRLALRDILETNTLHGSPFLNGAVNILNPKSAAGTAYDIIFITGLQSGVFPTSPVQNPILPDEERQILNIILKEKGRLAQRSEFVHEDPVEFTMLVSSCRKKLILSFARTQTGQSKPLAPSPFILEAGRALTGKDCFYEDIDKLPGYGYIQKVHEYSGFPPILTDESEYVGKIIKQALSEKNTAVLSRLEDYSDSFRRAVKAFRSRKNSNLLGVYEGIITDSGLLERLSNMLHSGRKIASPTGIEAYFRCPYRYFASKILNLKKLDAPEEVKVISPIDKGNIYHKVFHEFFETLKAQGLVIPKQETRLECIDIIKDITDSAVNTTEETGITGSRISWFTEKAAIQGSVKRFVDEEINNNKGEPRFFEYSFGLNKKNAASPSMNNPAVIDLKDGTKFNFYGRIDRIDVDENSGTITIIDYKTGGNKNYKADSLKGGEQMQLFLYLSCIRQVLPDLENFPGNRGVYYFATKKGEFKRVELSDTAFSEKKEEAETLLALAVNNVNQGLFFPYPGKKGGNCTYCDFNNICPRDIVSILEDKQKDPVLSEFTELKEID
jgi:ATP-dependent helicase/DNAse subunit B